MLEVILVISCYVTNNLKPDNVKQYMFSYFVSVGKEFACRLGVLVIIWVSSVIRLSEVLHGSLKERRTSKLWWLLAGLCFSWDAGQRASVFHWLLATPSYLPNMSLQHGIMLHQGMQAARRQR